MREAMPQETNPVGSVSAERKFPRYGSYKASKIPFVAQIPSHWRIEKLKYLASVRFSSVDKKSEEGETPVRLCNYTDVYNRDVIVDDPDFMQATATEAEVKKFTLHRGDVLITKDSEEWDDIAVPAFVAQDLPGVLCGYHLALVRPKEGELDGSFLSRAFSAHGIREQFHIAANGITRFGLANQTISGALFPVPPLDEQRTIAAFLNAETGKIDALIAKKERLIKLLQEKRQALISQAVTKGIDSDRSRQPTQLWWIPYMPATWTIKRIKHLGEIRYGLGEPPERDDDGIPFIRATDIDSGEICAERIQRISRSAVPWQRAVVLKEYDILIVRSGAYTADSAVVPNEWAGAIAGYDMVLRVNHASPAFMGWVLLSNYVRTAQLELESTRAAQPHLNAHELGNALVLLPPLAEQREIAAFLDCERARIEATRELIGKAIDWLRIYRSALITAAVTGQIDVHFREEAPCP